MKMRLLTAVLLALACFAPRGAAQQTNWPADAAEYRFHMVGNAHIDAVWLWPWQEALSVVHSTFRSALDRMKETPDFIFTASSAQFFEWVEQNDPAMLDEIRQRVKDGRFVLAGGWWVEPDVNMPDGESLLRQGLYGQRTFERLFGRTATFGYNPDSFGHPGTLPQILKLQGLDDYVFMRPMRNEKQLPGPLFWWEAPDGSRVLTYRIPISYTTHGGEEAARLAEIVRTQPSAVKDLMAFYGVGDHGGGPAKQSIRAILAARGQPGAPQILFSSPAKYFAEVRTRKDLEIPVVHDDLQFHSVGCYTAESEMKKGNRASEMALQTAEKIAAVASFAWGGAYPQAEFTRAWKDVLFMQFHDSMAGTSLPSHYDEARAAHGYALDTANRAMNMAAQKLAWQVPAQDPESQYVLVFNPHAWPVSTPVEYDLNWPANRQSRLEDDAGRPVPHQIGDATTVAGDRHGLVFQAQLPAFGYRQYRLRPAAAEPAPAGAAIAADRTLENNRLRVRFGDDGGLAIFDKTAGREVFRGGATGGRAVVIEDLSDTWSHNVAAYTNEIGAFGKASFRVLENGPVRAAIRVRTTYGASNLETDWYLYAGARELEARVRLDWHEHQKILKFSFPLDVDSPRATYEVPDGNIVRLTDGHEYPGQRWIDVTGDRAGTLYGLAIINDAKYGYSVSGGDLRISIARGAVYALHMPKRVLPDHEYIWQDQGIQTFRMLLVPHSGSWRESAVVRRAEEFTAPLPVIYQGIHLGSRPQSASFLSIDQLNIVAPAIKLAEDGSGDLIVRCYETDGKSTEGALNLPFLKTRWRGRFRAYEIKTLRIAPRTGRVREVNALEQ